MRLYYQHYVGSSCVIYKILDSPIIHAAFLAATEVTLDY